MPCDWAPWAVDAGRWPCSPPELTGWAVEPGTAGAGLGVQAVGGRAERGARRGLAGAVTGSHAGRRYTLTEGDFHHLKNARLTHLHLPPLKIVTIHECDLGEASAATPPHAAAPKANLAIFQVSVGVAAGLGLGG